MKYNFAIGALLQFLVPGTSGNVGKLPRPASDSARAVGRESPRACSTAHFEYLGYAKWLRLHWAFEGMAIATFDTSMRPFLFHPPASRPYSMVFAATQISHAQPPKKSYGPQAWLQDEDTFITTHQKDAERSDPCSTSPMDDMIVCSAASAGQDPQCHLACSWA